MELSEYLNRKMYQNDEWVSEDVARVDIGYDEEGAYILTQGRTRKRDWQGGINSKDESTIFLYSEGVEWLAEIKSVLNEDEKADTSATIQEHVRNIDGQYRTEGDETPIDKIIVEIDSNGVHLLAYHGEQFLGSRLIPRAERLEDGEHKGENHLKTLFTLITQVSESYREQFDDKETGTDKNTCFSEGIDEELKKRCSPSFRNNQHADAAETAIQIVEERVDEMTGDEFPDQYGKALMEHAFSPNNGPLSAGDSNNEMQGVMFLFKGSVQGLLNPLKHRKQDPEKGRYLDDLDRQQAYNIIRFSDLLLQIINEDVKRDDS